MENVHARTIPMIYLVKISLSIVNCSSPKTQIMANVPLREIITTTVMTGVGVSVVVVPAIHAIRNVQPILIARRVTNVNRKPAIWTLRNLVTHVSPRNNAERAVVVWILHQDYKNVYAERLTIAVPTSTVTNLPENVPKLDRCFRIAILSFSVQMISVRDR